MQHNFAAWKKILGRSILMHPAVQKRAQALVRRISRVLI
jgi:hypothetical protein